MSGLMLIPMVLSLTQGPQGDLPRAARVDPPSDSGGTILEVFGDDLLLLSVGPDSEIRTGDRFTVYRMEPRPEYVGEAEVTHVGAHYALAHMRRLTRGKNIRVTDRTTLADKIRWREEAKTRERNEKILRGGAIIDQRPPK
jgi:hypothetical protein